MLISRFIPVKEPHGERSGCGTFLDMLISRFIPVMEPNRTGKNRDYWYFKRLCMLSAFQGKGFDHQ